MGKKLNPEHLQNRDDKYKEIFQWHIDPNFDPYMTIYYDSGSTWIHWLEFCMVWIVPKLKGCCSSMLKEFMMNFFANFHEGARCVHPVDWLYEIYLKEI